MSVQKVRFMKNVFIRVGFLYIFCVFALKVNAMEMGFQGSAEEVENKLYSVFPIGTQKAEVVSIAKSKLELDDSEFKSHDYGEDPLVYKKEGKELFVYSWIEMNVAEYRSIKKMFIKTTVMAKLFFDNDDKLNGIEVRLYGDSL